MTMYPITMFFCHTLRGAFVDAAFATKAGRVARAGCCISLPHSHCGLGRMLIGAAGAALVLGLGTSTAPEKRRCSYTRNCPQQIIPDRGRSTYGVAGPAACVGTCCAIHLHHLQCTHDGHLVLTCTALLGIGGVWPGLLPAHAVPEGCSWGAPASHISLCCGHVGCMGAARRSGHICCWQAQLYTVTLLRHCCRSTGRLARHASTLMR
jgi:hypothetical protein